MNLLKLLLPLLLLAAGALRAQPAAPPGAGPAVTVEVGRTYCLVRFVDMAAGERTTYRGSRRVFEASAYNTPEAQRQLRRYRQLGRDNTFQRDEYPAGRLAAQASFEPAYLAAAADAADLPDLRRRAAGLYPNETLLALDSVYRYFEPAFEALAWQPHAASLRGLRDDYARYLTSSGLLAEFGRLRTFYGAVWPDALPYRVLLAPELDAGAAFTNQATATANLVLLECHPTSRDFTGGTTVVFHEMSHTLSQQQRRQLQHQLEGWFRRRPSPSRRYAYHLLEEALATTCGEWLYAQQAGHPETSTWYADDYINRYSHALYPLVSSYVDRGRTLDSTFVTEAVIAFDTTLPQAAADYGNLFRHVLYWTDTDDPAATYQPFRERFRSTFTYSASPILGQASGLEKARGGDYLPVILVTKSHAATLRYLRQQLPALRPYRLRPADSFVLTTTGPAGPLVLVCAHAEAQLTEAARLLEKQGRIDPARPMQPLTAPGK